MKFKVFFKKLFFFFMFMLLVPIFAGCGNNKSNENSNSNNSNNSSQESNKENKQETKKANLSLVGKWKSDDEKNFGQEATITEDKIEINWINDEDNSIKGLYWSGTYESPKTTEEKYTWISKGDTEKMKSALLASQGETKEFQYENGLLNYEVTALGVTKRLKLKRTS